jgi:hypothetical protein
MLDRLDVALLVVLVVLSGALMVACFLPRAARWSLPIAFASLALGIIATGWLALVLAEFGRFGRWPLLAALVALVSLLLLWRYRAYAKYTDSDQEERGEARQERNAENAEERGERGDNFHFFISAPSASSLRALRVPPHANAERFAPWEWVMLAVWLTVAVWLYFRPHEYVYGGTDAGVYVSLGAEIAQNGGFRIVDETLAGMASALQSAVLRPLPNSPGALAYLLPGFYVTDPAAGHLTPQFYPLHPVLQAVIFSVSAGGADGLRAELLLTGLWILLGTLAVYLTAREIAGPVVAALALAALSLSALQVWFGRYPTSEALTQFLLWVGIWCAARWLGERPPANLWAFVTGCAFGAVFLARIDSIVLLPVFSAFLVWRWARGWEPADSWFAAPLVLLVFHSLLHGHFLSAPYFYETMGYGLSLLLRLWPLLLAAIVGVMILLWQLPRHARGWRLSERVKRLGLGVAAATFLLYALFGWFVRPELNAATLRPDVFSGGEIPVLNHENWPRLGWYMTPLGVWLGVLGGCLMLWRLERRTVLLLALGLLFSCLYLWNISANPHHVYVMRRYVPAVMPFFILGGAYLLGYRGFTRQSWMAPPNDPLSKIPFPFGPALMALIAVVWLAGLGWAARGFVSQVDHAGLAAQVDALAARLPTNAVLLFDDQAPVGQGDVWGTPLKFVYGYSIFTLRQSPADVAAPLAEAIETWQNSGRPVVWIGATDWLDSQGYSYRTEQVTLTSQRLESSYEHKPQAILTETVILSLSYLESN